MTVKYLDHVRSVADACYAPRGDLVGEIWERWLEYERVARVMLWDVLSPESINAPMLRTAAKKLISLLYETETGTPESDEQHLREKDAQYGGSWCARGGAGAFFTMCRKADRFCEMMVKRRSDLLQTIRVVNASQTGSTAETIADTIGDWRRYLLLIEAYVVASRAESRTDSARMAEVGALVQEASPLLRTIDADTRCDTCRHSLSAHTIQTVVLSGRRVHRCPAPCGCEEFRQSMPVTIPT